MIRKYRYGTPFDTEALTEKIETAEGAFPYGEISQNEGFAFTYIMDEDDIVYGLGESNRGINKRGYCYISNCTDDAIHTEGKRSLYGAHNFIVVSGKTTFGLFFDYPSKLTFDIGYTRMDTLQVSCENADLDIYVIEGENAYDIVKQFRRVIGRSYIPPKFAFGFGQSAAGDLDLIAAGDAAQQGVLFEVQAAQGHPCGLALLMDRKFQSKIALIGGLLGVLSSLGCIWVTGVNQILAFAPAFIFMMIIPGHMINYSANIRK